MERDVSRVRTVNTPQGENSADDGGTATEGRTSPSWWVEHIIDDEEKGGMEEEIELGITRVRVVNSPQGEISP